MLTAEEVRKWALIKDRARVRYRDLFGAPRPAETRMEAAMQMRQEDDWVAIWSDGYNLGFDEGVEDCNPCSTVQAGEPNGD